MSCIELRSVNTLTRQMAQPCCAVLCQPGMSPSPRPANQLLVQQWPSSALGIVPRSRSLFLGIAPCFPIALWPASLALFLTLLVPADVLRTCSCHLRYCYGGLKVIFDIYKPFQLCCLTWLFLSSHSTIKSSIFSTTSFHLFWYIKKFPSSQPTSFGNGAYQDRNHDRRWHLCGGQNCKSFAQP